MDQLLLGVGVRGTAAVRFPNRLRERAYRRLGLPRGRVLPSGGALDRAITDTVARWPLTFRLPAPMSKAWGL